MNEKKENKLIVLNKMVVNVIYPKIVKRMEELDLTKIEIEFTVESHYAKRRITSDGKIYVYAAAESALASEFGSDLAGFYFLGDILNIENCPTFLRSKARGTHVDYIIYAKGLFKKLQELEKTHIEIDDFIDEVIEFNNNFGKTRSIITEKSTL